MALTPYAALMLGLVTSFVFGLFVVLMIDANGGQ